MSWLLVAVSFLLLIFLLSGFQKTMGYFGKGDFSPSSVAKHLSEVSGLPTMITGIALLIGVAIELLAPIAVIASLLLSYSVNDSYLIGGMSIPRIGYIGIWGLIVFTILATLVYHYPSRKSQHIPFLKNLAILGGLMLLAREFETRVPQPPFPSLL